MLFWLSLCALAAWETVLDEKGYVVELRHGAKLDEVRVSTRSRCEPKAIFQVIWRQEDYAQFVPYTKANRILKDAPNERLVYSQLALPVIKDRDFTVRLRVEHDVASGLYLVTSEAADAEGPAQDPDYVRIRFSKTSWTLEPRAEGGTDVTYVNASEAGGAIPRWIRDRANRDAAKNFVAAILGRNACAP